MCLLLRVIAVLGGRRLRAATLQAIPSAIRAFSGLSGPTSLRFDINKCLTITEHGCLNDVHYMHLGAACCKRHKKSKKSRKGPCAKKRKKRRGPMKSPTMCYQDLHKRPKHNAKCCPCKKPKMMDLYRKQ